MYLEKLLEETVVVEADSSGAIAEHGTMAILSGLLEDVYERLNDWEQVTDYLQNVVPLPFRPDFKFKSEIAGRFAAEDYRVVPLTLRIGSRTEDLFRPYHDGMFSHGGKHPPNFFDVAYDGHKSGFAWVCINDARRVLRDANLRGILIKKFGFSISNRTFLEPYFGRTVFSRRITGELIVQERELIPNAARSDFEHNTARQAFFQRALPRLIGQVSEWAAKIQDEEKAREVLAETSGRLSVVNRDLPSVQRDRERLLQLNIELARMERDLSSHLRVLRQIDPDQLANTEALLKECQQTIRQSLVEKRQTRRRLEQRVVRSVQREALGPTEEEKERLDQVPKTLVELLDFYDLLDNPELRRVIRLLDEEVLQVNLDEASYRQTLAQLRESLEESP